MVLQCCEMCELYIYLYPNVKLLRPPPPSPFLTVAEIEGSSCINILKPYRLHLRSALLFCGYSLNKDGDTTLPPFLLFCFDLFSPSFVVIVVVFGLFVWNKQDQCGVICKRHQLWIQVTVTQLPFPKACHVKLSMRLVFLLFCNSYRRLLFCFLLTH